MTLRSALLPCAVSGVLLSALLGACAHKTSAVGPPGAPKGLHVPSPDWRDQVVYFLMIDRFEDGDPENNDQGAGEHDPKDGRKFSGGDLAGILDRLDYIRDLGATAVWLTPPVANVWYDPELKMTGYHGYWAENFKKVDAHFGSLEDYRRLSIALHRRGMYLIQDIVTNHTGDFFVYDGGHDPSNPAKSFRLKKGVVPGPRPSQAPFSFNDVRLPEHRAKGVYHWTPAITDYNDDTQRLTYQMSGLDDLNTSNPEVRAALKESYRHWIEAAGVDGFRIDTAKFVDHSFWKDFIHSKDPSDPGIRTFAASLGKKDFMTVGEIWTNATPFSDKEDAQAAAYLGSPYAPEMRSVLNFPLALDIRSVFAKGIAPAVLSYRLGSLGRHYGGGRACFNFIENHDMSRFLAEGNEEALVQALSTILTIPGVPVLYAGTEQGFSETRAALFSGGFGSGGEDHDDKSHRVYKLIRKLTELRRKHEVFRRGTVVPLYGSSAGPGMLAYRVDSGEGRSLVLMNTAEDPTLLADLDTGIAEGSRLKVLFSHRMKKRWVKVGAGGRLSLAVPGRGILVLKTSGKIEPVDEDAGEIAITSFPKGPLSGTVSVEGTAKNAEGVSLVIDGRLGKSVPARLLPDGRWTAAFQAASLPDGGHSLRAMGRARKGFALSERVPFQVELPFKLARKIDDPAGDDKGPKGVYRYPLADGFDGMADIRSVALHRRGPSAKLVIKMTKGISSAWNPANGFDHVVFHIFIDFPDLSGASALPGLRARMPKGVRWDYAAFLAGWKTGLYSAEGASADAYGAQVQPAPKVKADKAAGTVEVSFDLDAFDGVRSFDGARFYIATWDYDGMEGTLRDIAPKPEDYTFGGGTAESPRIMDDTKVFP